MRKPGRKSSRFLLGIVVALAWALAGVGTATATVPPPGPLVPTGPPSAATLALQAKAPDIVQNLKAGLGDGYAGVWMDPAAARFQVGLAPATNRQAALGVLADLGVADRSDLVAVASTWDQLVAGRKRWSDDVVADLLASGEATVGIDTSRNAVAVTVGDDVPASRLAAVRDAAAADPVNVALDVRPAGDLHVTPAIGYGPEPGSRLARLRAKLHRRAHKHLHSSLGCVRAGSLRRSNRLSVLVTSRRAARRARRIVRHTAVKGLRARRITHVRTIKRRDTDAAIARVRKRLDTAIAGLGFAHSHLLTVMRGIPSLTRCDPVTLVVAPGHSAAELSWARAQRHRYGADRVKIARGTLPA